MKMHFFNNTMLFVCFLMATESCSSIESNNPKKKDSTVVSGTEKVTEPWQKPIDTTLFDNLCKGLANGDTTGRWPVKSVYPLAGAILPFNRVVAFYGNLYSKKINNKND